MDDKRDIRALARDALGMAGYRVVAYRRACLLRGDCSAAETAVLEGFLGAWRAAVTGRVGDRGTRAWLLALVHRRAIRQLRVRHEVAA